jgi:hypothetical protein
MRTCGYCGARMPLADLVQVATGLWCSDFEACQDRAGRSGLYPQAEDEQAMSIHQASQGAIRGSRTDAREAMYAQLRADRAGDPREPAEIT